MWRCVCKSAWLKTMKHPCAHFRLLSGHNITDILDRVLKNEAQVPTVLGSAWKWDTSSKTIDQCVKERHKCTKFWGVLESEIQAHKLSTSAWKKDTSAQNFGECLKVRYIQAHRISSSAWKRDTSAQNFRWCLKVRYKFIEFRIVLEVRSSPHVVNIEGTSPRLSH